jgi:hypothetical protein
LSRQVIHWTKAAQRLADLDDLASPAACQSLERYLGLSIRRHLTTVAAQWVREGDLLQAALAAAVSPADLLTVRQQLLNFRNRYMRVETTLVFFADVINTRTNPKIAGYILDRYYPAQNICGCWLAKIHCRRVTASFRFY